MFLTAFLSAAFANLELEELEMEDLRAKFSEVVEPASAPRNRKGMNCWAAMFHHSDFQGKLHTVQGCGKVVPYTEWSPNIDANDRVSSLMVFGDCGLVAYEHGPGNGRKGYFEPGEHDIAAITSKIGNDVISNVMLVCPEPDIPADALLIGAMGSNTCPGSEPILDCQACRGAARSLGKQFHENQYHDWKNGGRPEGCFLHRNDKVYCNDQMLPGGVRHGDDRRVCKACYAELFSDAAFQGQRSVVKGCGRWYTTQEWVPPMANDVVSSMKIHGKCSMKAFEHQHTSTGRVATFPPGFWSIGDVSREVGNDAISQVELLC